MHFEMSLQMYLRATGPRTMIAIHSVEADSAVSAAP